MLVMCNGMGRAGSTYQYNLVRCLVERSATGECHGYIVPGAQNHSLSVPKKQVLAWAEAP